MARRALAPGPHDALLVVDLQNDFVSGALAVAHASEVIAPVNRAIDAFASRGLPVFASRDWHPPDHCSFRARGGIWPVHCVAGTAGAEFVAGLRLAPHTVLIEKATERDVEAYSALSGTRLGDELQARGVTRLFVAGLATDYCVLNTVRDAVARGVHPVVLIDGCRAVNLRPTDGAEAEAEMHRLGAVLASTDDLTSEA